MMGNQEEIRAFIDLEADLLDSKAFRDWLDLWDEDGIYIVPVDGGASDDNYEDRLNFAYDDAAMRKLRVNRLMSGEAISTETTSKTIRSVSRLRLLEDDGEQIKLRCAQFISENRRGNLRIYPADVEYTLRRGADGLRLVRKVVELLQAPHALASIGYIL